MRFEWYYYNTAFYALSLISDLSINNNYKQQIIT